MFKIIITIFLLLFSKSYAFETMAKQAIILDYDTNEILYKKNSNEKSFPSSMTKIMTAYIIFEKLDNGELKLNDKFIISNNAWKQEGSRMFLNINSKVSVDALLKGLLVDSGNDSAIALAEGSYNSVEKFVEKMNLNTKELKLKDTNYTNPVGFSEKNHYMSVRDIAKLSQTLIKNFPNYYNKYFSIAEYKYNNILQQNRNQLLGKFEGLDGIKTGHTEAGGYGIALSAKQNDRRLIAVINGLKTENERLNEGKKILDYGFNELHKFLLFEKNSVIKEIPILYGKKKIAKLTTDKNIYATAKNKDDIKIEFIINDNIKAPLQKNQKVGKLVVKSLDNTIIYDLLNMEEVKEVNIFKKIFLKIYYFGKNLIFSSNHIFKV